MLNWKPINKKAAVCFSIDDIHPGKSTDFYEAGGDLDSGGLGKLNWLLNKHPELKVTLFTTADWMQKSPFPTYKILKKIPQLRDRFYLSPTYKKGTMDLRNHPLFINYLNENKQFEVAFHGLHHVHKGLKIPVEFQNQSESEIELMINKMINIFEESKVNFVRGICPPSWNAPIQLLNVLEKNKIEFINSSRDILTPISKNATCNMSGLNNTSILYPQMINNYSIIHFPVNFQANSRIERAMEIIENDGLLSIKGHIVKSVGSYLAIDGITDLYMNFLDLLFSNIKNKYGNEIWFTSMGEISEYILKNN